MQNDTQKYIWKRNRTSNKKEEQKNETRSREKSLFIRSVSDALI